MAEQKIFIINLRREFIKKPLYQRTKKAVTAVKEYISKHLKTKEVKIGRHLNEKIWERGNRHPLPKVKVKAIKENDIAYVELPEFEFEFPKPKEDKKVESPKKPDFKEEDKKEQQKELTKELENEERIKEKKEHHHEAIEVPQHEVKEQEQVKEAKAKRGRVVGSTGKKSSKEAKP